MSVDAGHKGKIPRYALLNCNDCNESYLLGSDSIIVRINDLFDGLNIDENIHFVMNINFNNHDEQKNCVDLIEDVMGKLSNGIECFWVCKSCNNIEKIKSFPSYFTSISPISHDCMYLELSEGRAISVLLKTSLVINYVNQLGRDSYEESDIIRLAQSTMLLILGHGPENINSNSVLDISSTPLNKYDEKCILVEVNSFDELLQCHIKDWDVPGWVVTFELKRKKRNWKFWG